MKVLSDKNPLDVFARASDILNRAVEHTLGPEGTNSAVHYQNYYNIINDGKSIIEQLTSLDPEIAPAMETLKQSSFETNRKAGDGTTSTIIIMNQLIQKVRNYLEKNSDTSRVYIANKILEADKKLQELIQSQKTIIDDRLYEQVAKVSLGSSEYSRMIADAFIFLEGKGVPALVKSDIPGVEVKYIDGVNLTKTSVASSMFIDLLPNKELSNVQIITIFQPIDRFEEIFQLVRKLNQEDKYTIMLYNEISNAALDSLLFNLSQGRSKVIPISIKNYGKDMTNMFDELSKYCSTDIIDGGTLKSTDISKIKIGYVDKAVIALNSLVLSSENPPAEEYKYISTKACIIRAGGATKIDMEDTYRRIEDAIYSLSGAIENGVMFGGYGKPYLDLAKYLAEEIDTPDYITEALCYINVYLFNRQCSDEALDSALVISQVVKNAFITAAQAITTYAIVYDNIR